MRTETVELAVADGTRMRAHVARPDDGGPHPGLLVFQEAYGVTAHIKDVAGRFARAGYVAIAPELFHRTAPPGFEGDYRDFPAVEPHFRAVTAAGFETDIRAAHAWLTASRLADPQRLGAVGFCMGGRVAFIAATLAVPLRAAVAYYGGGIAPALLERAPRAQAPILFFWGGRDKNIPPVERRAIADALAAAKKSFVDVVFSEADHAFFRDAGQNFHPVAAAEAWALTLAFLKDSLR
jgi:carboxymethylenebutenolidase